MSFEEKKHYDYLDIAKGIAIIAVVLGHCFPENIYGQGGISDKIATVVYDFCYAWHMPLFFYISGFLFYKAWNTHSLGVMKTKAIRLLIPYLTFSVIYIPLRLFMSDVANSDYHGFWRIIIGVSPNGGVWYLYCLFLFMLVSVVVVRNEKVLLICTACAGVTNCMIHCGLIICYSVLKYTMAFYVFFLLGLVTHLINNDAFSLMLNEYLGVKIGLFIVFFVIQEVFNIELTSIITAVLGINIVIILAQKIQSPRLKTVGRLSMEIYLVHGPVLVALRIVMIKMGLPNLLISVFLFLLGLLISIFVGKRILHINRGFEFVFLGIRKDNRGNNDAKDSNI